MQNMKIYFVFGSFEVKNKTKVNSTNNSIKSLELNASQIPTSLSVL